MMCFWNNPTSHFLLIFACIGAPGVLISLATATFLKAPKAEKPIGEAPVA
jgi:hypothetical protein